MATFYNQATLSYNGNVTVSNITAGEILDVVSASKTPLTETYSQGADIAYAISVLNTGTTDLTGLTVTNLMRLTLGGIIRQKLTQIIIQGT